MSDEDNDYSDSGSDEEVDPLVDGYRTMENMFEETGFHNYDPDFDAYYANDANLDVAVLAWQAALNLDTPTGRTSDVRTAAITIAETTMQVAYSSTLRTQRNTQRNKRRRSD